MSADATEGAGAVSAPPADRPYLWMLAAALAFAAMAAFAHALSPLVDWRLIALARSGLALLFAVLLVRASGVRLVVWRPFSLWMRSIAGSVSMVCTFYALTRLPIAEVLTIANVFPVWVALLSWPLLGELPGWSVWLAVTLGISGVALVEQPHWLDGNTAALVVLTGSMFTAVAMLGLHRLRGIDSRAIVVHFSGVAAVICGVLVLLGGGEVFATSVFNPWSIALLMGMGISATIGQVYLTKAFAAGAPAKVSVVALCQVAFALVLDIVIWRRTFNVWSLAGIALVVAPTAWLLLSQAARVGARAEREADAAAID